MLGTSQSTAVPLSPRISLHAGETTAIHSQSPCEEVWNALPSESARSPFSSVWSLQLWQEEALLRQKLKAGHSLQTIPVHPWDPPCGTEAAKEPSLALHTADARCPPLLGAASSREFQPVPQGSCLLCREAFPFFQLSQSNSISLRCLPALLL